MADLEPRVRALVQARLARGRVEVNVSLQLRQVPPPDVELNAPFVQALSAALRRCAGRRRHRRRADGPGTCSRLPQALTIRERLADGGRTPEPLAALVEAAVDGALAQLDGHAHPRRRAPSRRSCSAARPAPDASSTPS